MVLTPPTLVTERLELRPPVAEDFPAMTAIIHDSETARHLGPRLGVADHFLRFCRNAGSWLLYGYGGFMVRLRGSEEVIGSCGLFHGWRDLGPDFDDHPEGAWILRSDQVGRGIGFEAMAAVLEWFDRAHGPRRIVCMTTHDNAPSIALAGKLGFTLMREVELDTGEAMRLFERLPG